MANIPVYCSNCDNFFSFKGLIGGDAINITLQDLKISPCPNCGGTGRALDGTYNFIGESIEFLSGPAVTKQKLRHLAEILGRFRREGEDYENLKEEIDQELPEFSSISKLLPKSKEELYAFIAMLLTLIGLIIQQSTKQVTHNTNIEINQVINKLDQSTSIYNENFKKDKTIEEKYEKVGRNDLCPCKSGKKYKHCHLNKD